MVLPSLVVIKKAVDEKHKAQTMLPTQGQCHSSNRKHGQCVLVALALKHTLAIIGDVVAWTNTIHEKGDWKETRDTCFEGQTIQVKSSECGAVLQ